MRGLRQRVLGTVIFLFVAAVAHAQQPIKRTALDDYIAKPDAVYQWKLASKTVNAGVTTYVLELTSQTWRSKPEVDRPVWKHWLTIYKPAKVEFDTAFIRIGGGDNGPQPPRRVDPTQAAMAVQTSSVTMELGQIPNQPLTFNDDGQPRREDDLIAYCWIKYLDTGDPTWLPRLPMVKSVVRAMDAATEFLASAEGGETKLKHFVVAGGSKRGWTTWLTGVVDPRVTAIIPIVIDIVNVRATMANHYSAYGFWAPAVGDYLHHKVMQRSETPAYAEMLKIIDPYSYLDRLQMPKLVLNAAGDQFFTPDSSRFYFDDLKGPKFMRYVPNGDHSLKETDAAQSLLSFYSAILEKTPIPTLSWKLIGDTLEAKPSVKPVEAKLWQASNPSARDFRVESIGRAYKSSELTPDAEGVYRTLIPKPSKGWTAYFIEFKFKGPKDTYFKFTTPVQVSPDTLPHSYQDYIKSIKGQ